MSILSLNDQLVDRTKSALYLYYLARASLREEKRNVIRRKVELSVRQMKKLDTDKIIRHVGDLHGHIICALDKENKILAHQKGEELVHHTFTHKISTLDNKLSRYLTTEDARKKRIEHLEHKITKAFMTKREKLAHLKHDINRLTKLYHAAKKTKKYNAAQLLHFAKRIEHLKENTHALR